MRIVTWSLKWRLVLELTLGATIFLTQASLMAQVSDTRPPKLASLSLSPLTVQVSAGPQPLALSMNVTDDLTGVTLVKVTVISPSGKQDQFALLSLVAGDSLNGIWQGAISMPQFSEAGLWQVKSVEVRDGVGNLARFDNSTMQTMAFPTEFTIVSSPEDLDPPQLTRINFASPGGSPVDISTSDNTIIVTLDLSDNLSGVDFMTDRVSSFQMELRSPISSQLRPVANQDFTLVAGTARSGTWQAKLDLPRFSEEGLWFVSSLIISDHVNNKLFLTEADLVTKGFPANFAVKSAPSDTLPPELLGVSFSPRLVDTLAGPDQVVVTISASDDLSGINFSPDNPLISRFRGVSFTSPSGIQVQSAGTFPPANLVSGNLRNGAWQTVVKFPQFSEAGVWKAKIFLQDVTNHETTIDDAELRNRTLPSDLVVVKPSRSIDGTVADPAVGGAVEDEIFGARAEVRFPPKALRASTEVSIDVLQEPRDNQWQSGGSYPATHLVRFGLTPQFARSFQSPGLTVVLPLVKALIAGTPIELFQLDRTTGNMVPAIGVDGRLVVGTADSSGMSATFSGVARLPLLVGFTHSVH
jgi:hypothetical protein